MTARQRIIPINDKVATEAQTDIKYPCHHPA